MCNCQKFRFMWCVALLAVAISLVERPAILPFAPSPALAQGSTCPDTVKKALASTDKQCKRTGRNKACYGNQSASVEAQAGITNLKFSKPGDIADLKAIHVLRVGAMDTDAKTWGVVLMVLQADSPDAQSTDNATLLLFGDVEMTNNSQEATTERPTQIAEFLTAQPSSTARPAPPYAYKPMQAFYVKTGSGDPACKEAPRDGILIQTPQGKQKVEFSVDGALIQVGSTAFLQAQAGGEMTISTLEGAVTVIAFGQAQTATTMQRIRLPLDANLKASGPPKPPEFYDNAAVQALPISILPQAVTILPAPPPGSVTSQWIVANDAGVVNSGSCITPFMGVGKSSSITSVTIDPGGNTLWFGNPMWLDGLGGGAVPTVLTSTGGGTYTWQATYTAGPGTLKYEVTLHLVSPTHADGEWVNTISSPACVGTVAFHMDRVDTPTPTP